MIVEASVWACVEVLVMTYTDGLWTLLDSEVTRPCRSVKVLVGCHVLVCVAVDDSGVPSVGCVASVCCGLVPEWSVWVVCCELWTMVVTVMATAVAIVGSLVIVSERWWVECNVAVVSEGVIELCSCYVYPVSVVGDGP